MPNIISSAELRNKYNEVSELCHKYGEPTFVTKNGKGDLAIMSIEAYEQMTARFELYSLIQEGMDAVERGDVRSYDDAMEEIRAEIKARRSRYPTRRRPSRCSDSLPEEGTGDQY